MGSKPQARINLEPQVEEEDGSDYEFDFGEDEISEKVDSQLRLPVASGQKLAQNQSNDLLDLDFDF